jgi:endonuclease YncB( thermonuclease family)
VLAKLKSVKDWFFLIVLLLSFTLNIFFYQKTQKWKKAYSQVFTVTKVFDGDSFTLQNNQSIRLSNVEAPELQFCGGKEAKELLEKLVLNKPVKLEVISHDQYGRLIALVYTNNKLVNEIILKEGWAKYDGSPSPKRDILKKAYEFAQNNQKGIFKFCHSQTPPNPNCLIKGNISRKDGKKTYHFPGCSEYERTTVEKDLGERWFCNEKEAQEAGYKKASNCFDKSFNPK